MQALVQRIDKKLKAVGYQLRKTKGGLDSALGPYYAINMANHYIAEQNVDPEMMGRELGVVAI